MFVCSMIEVQHQYQSYRKIMSAKPEVSNDQPLSQQTTKEQAYAKEYVEFMNQIQEKRHDEVDNILRDRYKFNVFQEVKALKRMRSRRQIERNRFNTDLTPKGDIHRVPIDGDIEQGSRIYMQNCSSCHSLESVVNKQTAAAPAPSLARIYGQPAGSLITFSEYTQPLLRSKIVWNSWNLYNWAFNPQRMVSGTLCMKGRQGIVSEEQRTDLTKFIKQFTKNMNTYVRIQAGKHQGMEKRDYEEFGHEIMMQRYRKLFWNLKDKEESEEYDLKLKAMEEQGTQPPEHSRFKS